MIMLGSYEETAFVYYIVVISTRFFCEQTSTAVITCEAEARIKNKSTRSRFFRLQKMAHSKQKMLWTQIVKGISKR